MLFLVIGLSLPLVERVFPEQYLQASQPELARTLLESPVLDQMGSSAACLRRTLAGDTVNFQRGRALYPRYYEAHGGESFTDSFGYKISDQGRMVFTLMRQGQSAPRIVFKMDDAPSFFPHAGDVTLVFGSDGNVWFAFVEKGEDEAFYISSDFDVSLCR
jgi:hypothetical protein